MKNGKKQFFQGVHRGVAATMVILVLCKLQRHDMSRFAHQMKTEKM